MIWFKSNYFTTRFFRMKFYKKITVLSHCTHNLSMFVLLLFHTQSGLPLVLLNLLLQLNYHLKKRNDDYYYDCSIDCVQNTNTSSANFHRLIGHAIRIEIFCGIPSSTFPDTSPPLKKLEKK